MDAGDVVGKTVLVGVTYVAADGSIREREQWHGVITAYDSVEGVQVRRPSGEVETLPPTLEKAEPGEYRLRGTGEVVSNPDFVSTWTVTASGDESEASGRTGPPVNEEWRSPSEWATFYVERRGTYDEFAGRLESLLDALLEEEGLYLVVLPFSVPHWDDLSQAIVRAWRAGDVQADPLESHVRVAGLSVRVTSLDDVPAIEEVITREFVVDPAASRTLAEIAARRARVGLPDGADALTYELPYYVVALDERRLELPEWSRFSGLKLQIEVRTELQNAWWEIVDALPLSSAKEFAPEVREHLTQAARSVARADNDLEKAQELIRRVLAEHEDAVASGDLELPVNAMSLLAYLRASELLRSLCELGRDVGLRYDPDVEPDWDDVERSLWLLGWADLRTLAELEDFLRQATPRARHVLTELARAAAEHDFTPWSSPDSIVEWLLLVLRRADAETVDLVWYRDELKDAVNTLIGNAVSPRDPDA